MAKALVFSDLHLHAHKDRVDRLQHCIDVLNWAFCVAEQKNCDYIFFLGDLFHDRAKIDVLNYIKTFEVFMQHMITDAANRDVYLLVGNHDMYHKERWDVNSVKPLKAIPRVNVIDTPQQIVLGGKKIDWMPYTDNPVCDLKKLKETNGGAGDLLLGHMSVHEAKLNVYFGTKADVIVEYDNDIVPVDVKVFADWPMVLLGHYHASQQMGHVEYVGSPLELTFGEAFSQKHIIVLDLDSFTKEYIVNDFSPRHLIITPQDVQNKTYNLTGNFVRVVVDDLRSKELVDLKREIASTYKVLSLDTKQKEKKIDEDKTVIEDAKSILMNIEEQMRAYMKEKGIPEGLVEAKLFATGMKCLEKKI
jgi:DNA repair exonuclease SbcCD nuclease subunit